MNPTTTSVVAKFIETEEFHIEAWSRDVKKRPIYLLPLSAVTIALFLGLFDAYQSYGRGISRWWVHPIPGLIMVPIVLFLFGPPGQRRMIRREARKVLTTPPTEFRFEFSDAGFSVVGRHGQTSYSPWQAMSRADEFSDGIVLYPTDGRGTYHWLPKSAFASEADFGQVLEWMRRSVSKHTKHSP